MGASEVAQQFLMILFRDLDNPAFMRLARSPEFSTYLTLRRYIWRSSVPHSRKLHEWYARGYLCCGLSRKKIAQRLGNGIHERTVKRDIRRLLEQGVVEAWGERERQVLVLGCWEIRQGVRIERYYLDRLAGATVESEEGERAEGAAQSTKGVAAEPTSRVPGPMAGGAFATSLVTGMSPLNRETSNTEWTSRGHPAGNFPAGTALRPAPSSSAAKSDAAIWQEVLREVELQLRRDTFDAYVRGATAQRVDGRWQITCPNARAQDWLEHRLGAMIRRELAAAAGERVGEVGFRTR